jgi:hypothetical protein
VLLPPFALLGGDAALAEVPEPDFDVSIYGLDGLSDKYGVYSPASRVLTSWTGPLLRLRRGSDDAEQDFGYIGSTGILDAASVASWLGGATGYATTLYDQSGNSRHAVQATTGYQPTVNLSGSIPCLQFSGTTGARLVSTTAVGFAKNVDEASLVAVCQYPNTITKSVLAVSSGVGNTRIVIQKAGGGFRAAGRRLDSDSQSQTVGLTGNTNWVVQVAGFDWAHSDLHHRVDEASETNTNFQTDGFTSDTDSNPEVTLGAQYFTNFFDGKATLFVVTRDLIIGTDAAALAASLALLKVT